MHDQYTGYSAEDLEMWHEQNIAKCARIELEQENVRRMRYHKEPNLWPEEITVISTNGNSRTWYRQR